MPVAHTNRLINETSPYLLQHAHNPVDWHPWGPEAFEIARREDKPIFLSIGYSTCYWCHVMERESFENPAIAELMNRLFVNIKVDREERPDVDQLYMLAVQVLRQHGGWPMSVFIAPDGRPFEGGTYFPPDDHGDRAGFASILQAVSHAWKNRRDVIEQRCKQLSDILHQLAEPRAPEASVRIDGEFINDLIDRSISDYDPKHGGFGGAPKFPRETLLELLLSYTAHYSPAIDPKSKIANRQSQIQNMVLHSLVAMAAGGIRDHLGGGFHRYSTDERWLVPHFEIMLYDNAMLAWLYIEAYRQSEQRQFADVARGILDFVLREMTSPQGAFYTAFDAEVDGREGLNYLWTPQQVEEVLGKDSAEIFNHVYGLDLGPNFADPHHGDGRPDANVLYLPRPMTDSARDLGLAPPDLNKRLGEMRCKLYGARAKRKAPLLDTKIITSWNALMIRALAHAGDVLQEPRYSEAGAKAADFLLRHHVGGDGSMWRTSRDGVVKHAAFLDDYAFLAQAILALSTSGSQPSRREQAKAIVLAMRNRFEDEVDGGFYFSAAGANDLIVRQKVASDSPLPSGNAAAITALVDLGELEAARRGIAAFAGTMQAIGEGASSLIQATAHYLRYAKPFDVEPEPQQPVRPISPEQAAGAVVDVEAAWTGPADLRVHLHIASGFHINAHAAADGYVATQLRVRPDDAAAVQSIDYPPGEERAFAFAEAPLRIYEDAVTIDVRFKESMAGEGPLALALIYQACTEDACLPAVTKQIDVARP